MIGVQLRNTEESSNWIEECRREFKLDSTFFADFLFGVLADREDCKSAMKTTFLPISHLFRFLSSESRDIRWLLNFLPLSRDFSESANWIHPGLWTHIFLLIVYANLEIVHKYFFLFSNKSQSSDSDSKKLKTLTLMDSWLHNRSCQPSSSAAPPLGHKRSN